MQKITPSLRDIIQVFQKYKFEPLSLQKISKELDGKENTINQRIIRDKNYFFQTRSTKPKIVILNVYRREILAHILKHQCQACRTTKPIDQLRVIYRDQNKANKHITNLQLVCLKCRIKTPPEVSPKGILKANLIKEKRNKRPRYEYKRIQIRTQQTAQNRYYEFNEEEHDNFPINKWYWVKDEDEEIASLIMTSILDQFGQEGWVLVQLIDISQHAPTSSFSVETEVHPFYDPQFEFFQCIFKRRMPD